MILMLAPGGNMTFGSMPSGATYFSDQYSLIKITNNSTADEAALQAAGCFVLSPFGGWGSFGSPGFSLLSDLYSADSGALFVGITGFPQYTVAAVFNDGTPANDGTWVKTGTGHGSGNWTQISTSTAVSAATAAAASATAAAASATAAAASAAGAGSAASGLLANLNNGPTPLYTSYATGLAAVTDGQTFFVQTADGLAFYAYLRVSGQGELQYISPLKIVTGAAAQTLASGAASAGPLPSSPLINLQMIDGLYYDGSVPNRANATTPDLNLLGASRPSEIASFANSNDNGNPCAAFQNTALTPFVAGTDGALKALRAQSAGGTADGVEIQSFIIPPGRWTLSFDAISDAGNVSLQFGPNHLTGTSTAAITGSWQTFSQTFVLGSQVTQSLNFGLANPAATFNIRIDNLRLTPGSTVPAATANGQRAYRRGVANRVAGGFIKNDGTTGNTLRLNLGAAQTFAGFSAVAVVKSGSNAQSVWGAILANIQGSYGGTGMWLGRPDITSGPNGYAFGNSATNLFSSMLGLDLANWTVIAFGWDATGGEIRVNDISTATTATAFPGFTAQSFELLSILKSPALGFNGQVAALQVWPRRLTSGELTNAYLNARATALGMGATPFSESSYVFLPIGDSITFGAGAQPQTLGWAQLQGIQFTPYLQGKNLGVTGNTLANVVARLASIEAEISRAQSKGKIPVCTLMIGTNDRGAIVDGPSAATYWGNVKSQVLTPLQTFMAASPIGGYLFPMTVIASNAGGGWESGGRAALNTDILADATLYSGVIDTASVLNTWSSGNYFDTLHPNNAGNALLAPVVTAKLQTVIPNV